MSFCSPSTGRAGRWSARSVWESKRKLGCILETYRTYPEMAILRICAFGLRIPPSNAHKTFRPRDPPRTREPSRLVTERGRAEQDVQLRALRGWHSLRGPSRGV